MAKAKKKEMKKAKEEKTSNTDDSKTFAFLATFLSIIGFIIALVTKKDDKYVMHYAKQSLVVFIASIGLGIIGWIFLFIPIFGRAIYTIAQLASLALWLISWIYALSGKMQEVPIVGSFAKKINL